MPAEITTPSTAQSPAPAGSKADDTCYLVEMRRYNSFKKHGNHGNDTSRFDLDPTASWEGIPEMVIFNFAFAFFLIALFCCLRKCFFNYGRIASKVFTPGDPVLDNNYDVFSHMWPSGAGSRTASSSIGPHHVVLEDEDVGYLAWLHLWAELSPEEILIKCGPSAVIYLQIQDVIIFYLSVITQFCTIFLLPMNMSGETQGKSGFSSTTIANLDSKDVKLYVHAVIAVGFFFYALYALRFFARAMHVPGHWRHYKHGIQRPLPLCTIIITKLPEAVSGNEELIKKYFREAYPEFVVTRVQFAYDVRELDDYAFQLKDAITALKMCERAGKKDEQISTRKFWIFDCLRRGKKTSAKQFYASEVSRLKKERDAALIEAKKNPLPICFVTFEKDEQADKVAHDFHQPFLLWFFEGKSKIDVKTSLDSELKPQRWSVEMAPRATDIAWENLGVKKKIIVRIALNIVALVILFVVSTPSVILNVYIQYLDRIHVSSQYSDIKGKEDEKGFWKDMERKILAQLIPTTLHMTLVAVLPYAIEACEEYSRYNTKSKKQMCLLVKLFVYEVFAVLVLPSFGLTGGLFFVGMVMEDPAKAGALLWARDRWDCVFLPDKSAFFINFIIMSAIFGAAITLIRPGHIVYYLYEICAGRSRYEMETARSNSVFRFAYSNHYAQMLAIFAITMTYCVTCPLIAPFGFVYFCFKQQIDRYNIYFAFDAHYVPQQLHRRVVNILVGCSLLSQISLVGFTILRAGGFTYSPEQNPDDMPMLMLTIIMLLTLAVSLALYFWQLFTGWFFKSAQISPFQYCLGGSESDTSSGGVMNQVQQDLVQDVTPNNSSMDTMRNVSQIKTQQFG